MKRLKHMLKIEKKRQSKINESGVQFKKIEDVHRNTDKECAMCSVVSNFLQPHELEPARLLCPWDSPGKNTGVGCLFLPPGDPPNPGIEPVSLVSPALVGRFFITFAT